jgi:Erv1 / Alr family
MTAIWGPMGWMTLHSMASLYSNTPTPSERQLMMTWLDMFRDTITCPSCRDHFTEMLQAYRAYFPNMLSSRSEFLLFTFRAHNAVNRRLSKPIYGTVADCFRILRKNMEVTPSSVYRNAYLSHIRKYWRSARDAAGFSALKKINEMSKIEFEYCTPRNNNFEEDIPEDTVEKLGRSASYCSSQKYAHFAWKWWNGYDCERIAFPSINSTVVGLQKGFHGMEMKGSHSHLNCFIHMCRMSSLFSS